MIFNEEVKPSGHITFKLIGPDGKVKETREIKNLIVTAGKDYLANWLNQGTQSDYFMRYIALGTGSTGALTTDTALDVEAGDRVEAAISGSGSQFVRQATVPADGVARAITEAGLFSAVTGGTLFARQVFAVINKGVSDALQVTWRITLS